MTQPPYATGDGEVAKLWSYDAYYDTISDQALIGQLINRGVLVNHDDLSKTAGDQITYPFVGRLQTHGFVDNATITGLENRPSTFTQAVTLYELNQVTKAEAKGTISAQRTGFGDMADICTDVNKMWLQERMTLGVVNQFTGNTTNSFTWDGLTHSTSAQLKEVNGGTTPTAPTSGRHVWANPTSNTTDQAVNADTTAKLKFSQILDLERRAKTTRTYIPKLTSNGVKFVFLTHVDCFHDLMLDTTDPHQGRDMILAQMAAGGKKEFTVGDTFRYFDTEIIVTDKMPRGVHSGTSAELTNTRRSVFCGMGAGCIAFGQGYSAPGSSEKAVPGFGAWDDTQEVGRIRRYRNGVVWGARKHVFNSQDYSTIVLTNYVAQ